MRILNEEEIFVQITGNTAGGIPNIDTKDLGFNLACSFADAIFIQYCDRDMMPNRNDCLGLPFFQIFLDFPFPANLARVYF